MAANCNLTARYGAVTPGMTKCAFVGTDGARKKPGHEGRAVITFRGEGGGGNQLAVERLAVTTIEKWASGVMLLIAEGVRAISSVPSECWSERMAPLASTNQ